MTPAQQHDLDALDAAIAAAGDSPDPFLVAERDRLIKVIEQQAAREQLAAAGAKPTAKIGDVVPGLQDRPTTGGYDRLEGLGRGLVTGTVTNNMMLGEMGAGLSGTAADIVSPAAIPARITKFAAEKLAPEATQAAKDWWQGLKDKASAYSSDWLAKDPSTTRAALNFTGQLAGQFVDPTIALQIPPGKAPDPLALEAATRADKGKAMVRAMVRGAEGNKAATLEDMAQRSHDLQATYDRAYADLEGTLHLQQVKDGAPLAAVDRQRFEAAINAANQGDTAKFEELLAQAPDRLQPVADKVRAVRDRLAELQDQLVEAKGLPEGQKSEFGLRFPKVVSTDTQRGYYWKRQQGGADYERVVKDFQERYQLDRAGAEALANDHIGKGKESEILTDHDHNASETGLRAATMKIAAADEIRAILADADKEIVSKKARRVESQADRIRGLPGRLPMADDLGMAQSAADTAKREQMNWLFGSRSRARAMVRTAEEAAAAARADAAGQLTDVATLGENALLRGADRAGNLAADTGYVRKGMRTKLATAEEAAQRDAWQFLFGSRARIRENLPLSEAGDQILKIPEDISVGKLRKQATELVTFGDNGILRSTERAEQLAARIQAAGIEAAAKRQAMADRLAGSVGRAEEKLQTRLNADAQAATYAGMGTQTAARGRVIEMIKSLMEHGRTYSQAKTTIRQLADPTSEIFKNPEKFEAITAQLPLWFNDKLKAARTTAALEVMGESTRPASNAMAAAKAYAKQLEDTAIQKGVAEHGRGEFVFHLREIPEGLGPYVTKVKNRWAGFGEDMYMLSPVHDLLENHFSGKATSTIGKAARILGKLNIPGLDQVANFANLTTNPGYIARNAVSAQLMDFANGPTRYLSKPKREAYSIYAGLLQREMATQIAPAAGRMLDKIVKVGDKAIEHIPLVRTANEFLQDYRRYVPVGEFTADLTGLMDDVGIPTANRGNLKPGQQALYHAGAAVRTTARVGHAAIEMADDAPRMARFAQELQDVVSIHGMPHPDDVAAITRLKELAGKRATDTYQNFAAAPEIVKELRAKSPVMGYAAYNLDVPRVWTGMLRTAVNDIADGLAGRVPNRKAAIAIGLDRLSGLLGITAAGSGAMALAAGARGTAREAAVGRQGYATSPGDAVLVSGDPEHEQTVNLTGFLPFETYVAVGRAVKQTLEFGPDDDKAQAAIWEAAKAMGRMFGQFRQGLQVASEIATGKDSYGKPYRNSDYETLVPPTAAGMGKTALHVVDRLTPSILRPAERKVRDYLLGKPDKEPTTEKNMLGFGRVTDVGAQAQGIGYGFMAEAKYRWSKRDDEGMRDLHDRARQALADLQARGLSEAEAKRRLLGYANSMHERKLMSSLLSPYYQPIAAPP